MSVNAARGEFHCLHDLLHIREVYEMPCSRHDRDNGSLIFII